MIVRMDPKIKNKIKLLCTFDIDSAFIKTFILCQYTKTMLMKIIFIKKEKAKYDPFKILSKFKLATNKSMFAKNKIRNMFIFFVLNILAIF
jgi:uncharacterized protein with von Willebrand factor type A (vWA) domain